MSEHAVGDVPDPSRAAVAGAPPPAPRRPPPSAPRGGGQTPIGRRGPRWWAGGRPVGLCILTGVIVLEAVAFFAAAFELLALAAGEWPAALLAAAIGALLLRKARALWSYHRSAWLMLVGLTTLGALVEGVQIARGHGGPGAWASLGWALATVVYLGSPGIRALFVQQPGDHR
jgi:hypothetical protein